jgi:hypothetical protein
MLRGLKRFQVLFLEFNVKRPAFQLTTKDHELLQPKVEAKRSSTRTKNSNTVNKLKQTNKVTWSYDRLAITNAIAFSLQRDVQQAPP